MTQPAVYAWCFDHGTLHRFPGGNAWCTATWIPFTAATEEAALEAKQAAWGDARFLDDLPVEQQLDVLETAAARQ
ncbi:hypothetical protein ACPB9J_16005 [Streptomyces lavendulocolor]|uniref:hypothetical protein n=1 Tax=Streptomyces lavendulocolor TaxID=67316 RepID=UPI003C2EFD49